MFLNKDERKLDLDRRSDEYENEVDHFYDFALHYGTDPNSIRCPCLECGHVKPQTIKEIRNHFICYSIDQSYIPRYQDEEPIPSLNVDTSLVIRKNHNKDIFMKNVVDIVEVTMWFC